jgi:ATP adenylyltransferase
MEHLWAPWRMEYVTGEKAEACILCAAPGAPEQPGVHVLHRGEHNYVILNRFPYNSGHLMVVPYQHLSEFTALSAAQLAEMMDIAQGVIEAFALCLRPDGVNLGMNLGQAAGAGIDDHVHLHLVPRWRGDTNFMTTVGGTRVVPQSLEACAAQIGPVLQEVMARRKAGAGQSRGTGG